MGNPWWLGIPEVKVASGYPKHVTFVYPYYENPEFLAYQARQWTAYPKHVRMPLSAIIVDDGSPEHPAEPILKGAEQPFPISLYRIEIDVRWNWPAARNIGFHRASDGWVFVTDMDHVVPPETAEAMILGQYDPKRIYCFARAEHTGADIHPHSASFLMTRKLFWKIGGYDERGSGFYGNDGPWRRRCAEKAKFAMLPDKLIRHEHVADSSTTRYLRKQPEDAGRKKALAVGISKALSFPYHQVVL